MFDNSSKKVNKRLRAIKRTLTMTLTPPPPCPVQELCDKSDLSASHPSSPYLPSIYLLSCSNPDRPTAWLSPPTTTTTKSPSPYVLPPFSLLLHPPTPALVTGQDDVGSLSLRRWEDCSPRDGEDLRHAAAPSVFIYPLLWGLFMVQ